MPSICQHNALEDDWDVLYLSPFTRGAENESRRLSLTTLRLVSLTILIAPNQPLRILGGYRRKVTRSSAIVTEGLEMKVGFVIWIMWV